MKFKISLLFLTILLFIAGCSEPSKKSDNSAVTPVEINVDFSYNINGKQVTFTPLLTPEIDIEPIYTWNFGGNVTENDQTNVKTPTVTYAEYGEYIVNLTVTVGGKDFKSQDKTIILDNTPIVAHNYNLNASTATYIYFIDGKLYISESKFGYKLREHFFSLDNDSIKTVHVFPAGELTYLGNVMNGKAQAFYHDHGVKRVEPAFEKEAQADAVLMFCKHCLRYSMGWCPVHHKVKSPYREPYYLVSTDGRRFRLDFDCKVCQMKVSLDNRASS